MKKNIGYNYKYPSSELLRAELIKNAGFDGVFIYSQYNPQAYIESILRSGLEIETLHLPYKKFEDGSCIDSRYVNNLWLDNSDSKLYLDMLYREIDFAAAYGIKIAVMHITGGSNPPAVSDAGLRFIEKTLNYCEQKKIVLCLENLRSLSHLSYVFSNLQSPFLKFCFDSGHANYMTHNAMSFPWDEYGKYLYCLHLNDNDGTKDTHSIPFTGNIDWIKISKEIYSLNANCNLTLEVRCSETQKTTLSEQDYLKLCYNSLQRIEQIMNC